jgi:peroxidase
VVLLKDFLSTSLLSLLDVLKQSGGPNWELPLGRRDSKTASLTTSNNNIPPPNSTLQNLLIFFKRQGLDEVDLVALSGKFGLLDLTFIFFRCNIYMYLLSYRDKL